VGYGIKAGMGKNEEIFSKICIVNILAFEPSIAKILNFSYPLSVFFKYLLNYKS
jgi:hypothetical protein